VGCMGQITLDSDSILANMQSRVSVLSVPIPPLEPKSPEVNMRGREPQGWFPWSENQVSFHCRQKAGSSSRRGGPMIRPDSPRGFPAF
jgi:hypothetical protein